MTKYFNVGLKNLIIGTLLLYLPVLVLQFIQTETEWITPLNNLSFYSLLLIILGCSAFAFGATNLFFASIFLNIYRPDSMKEHIYIHGSVSVKWGMYAIIAFLLIYLILVFTPLLSFNLTDGLAGFADYKEPIQLFICALTKNIGCGVGN